MASKFDQEIIDGLAFDLYDLLCDRYSDVLHGLVQTAMGIDSYEEIEDNEAKEEEYRELFGEAVAQVFSAAVKN